MMCGVNWCVGVIVQGGGSDGGSGAGGVGDVVGVMVVLMVECQ